MDLSIGTGEHRDPGNREGCTGVNVGPGTNGDLGYREMGALAETLESREHRDLGNIRTGVLEREHKFLGIISTGDHTNDPNIISE